MRFSFLLVLITLGSLVLSGASLKQEQAPVPSPRPTTKNQTAQIESHDQTPQDTDTPAQQSIPGTEIQSPPFQRPPNDRTPDGNVDGGFYPRWMLLATFVLAIATLILALVGISQARAAWKAAGAAENSANTFVRQNSPYLRLSGLSLEAGMKDRPEYPHIIYTLRNYGGGRAFLTEMSNNILLGPLPKVPQYKDITPYSPVGISLGHMDALPAVIVTFPDEIRTIQDVDHALERGQRLFVYGYVKCSDTLRQTHTFGFGYEYVKGRFVETGGKAYNCRHWEQEPDVN